MALNFPDSPTAGTVFGAWRYDGVKWGAVSGVSGGGSAGDITAVLAGAGLSGGGTEGDVSIALAVPVSVARGGTGATDAATALANLGGAPLASPTFTGDPKAPTPATADNDTSVATTAYVKAQSYLTSPVNLTSQVTGTLPVANGGTGATTGAVGPYLPMVAGSGNALTGALTIAPASGDAGLNLTKAASGTNNALYGRTGANLRWHLTLGDYISEAGSNSGSNFGIGRYNDAGVAIDTPLAISRSTGVVTAANGLVTTAGNIQVDRSGTAGVSAGLELKSNGRSWNLYAIHSGGSGEFWIHDNNAGAIRIGIDTSGNCRNQTGTWSAISDGRLKRDVQDFTEPGLAALTALRPVTFYYNGEGGTVDDGTLQYGLIAQEAQPHAPEVVGERQGWLSVDPGRLIYRVLNALREIDQRLRALEGK